MNNLANQIPHPYYAVMSNAYDSLLRHIRNLSLPARPDPPVLPQSFLPLLARRLPRKPEAVLFDIYGTLFTSGSGDIGTADRGRAVDTVTSAFDTIGAGNLAADAASKLADRFQSEIEREHQRIRSYDRRFPEVDVREIWTRALVETEILGASDGLEEFAVIYEMTANPVWPMPGIAAMLARLRDHLPMGIVSNAQFYTPLLFPALLESTIEELGFRPDLISLSYQHRIAKPDPQLFMYPLAVLSDQGIDSSRVVYVGNDMLNDVATATKSGCMTILFAGDRRSLRLRQSQPASGSIAPNSVARTLQHVGALVLDPEEKR